MIHTYPKILSLKASLAMAPAPNAQAIHLKKLYNATSKTQSTGGVRGIATGIGDYEIAAAGAGCVKACNVIQYLPARALCIAGCLLFHFL